MSKYGAIRTEIDGRTFASKAEAGRFAELKLMERGGNISGLECQPKYPLVVNGVKVATYVADFRYFDEDGRVIVEDVKGVRTDVYKLKAKLVKALHGIDIVEVEV